MLVMHLLQNPLIVRFSTFELVEAVAVSFIVSL